MYLGVEPTALSEERASDKPKAVADVELVLDHVAFREARVRIVPLVRAESCHDEQGEAYQHVRGQHV